MEEEILEKLLTKLIGLTEFGALRWHFAGDVSKAYVTIYKDARLKLTTRALDITEPDSNTVRVDARLHSPELGQLIYGLHRAARESTACFRTGRVQAVTPVSLVSTCQRLLEDDEQISLCSCLICNNQFDPTKTLGHLSQVEDAALNKTLYVCEECVNKLGIATAQTRLDEAAGIVPKTHLTLEYLINSDTLDAAMSEPASDTATSQMSKIPKE
ncbi:MAG: hypothetical protein AB1489_01500 [Acidobacteriota bacterium]